MLCVMQNHIVQAFANSGNAIKPVSFIRDLKSKSGFLTQLCCPLQWVPGRWWGDRTSQERSREPRGSTQQ